MTALCFGVVAASALGCHRRGYTDLYVDSMASEIRDLQDQLYEYDHEYRLLEQELDSLRRQNARHPSDRPQTTPDGQSPSRLQDSLSRDPLPPPKKSNGNGNRSSSDRLPVEDSSPQLTLPSIIAEPESLLVPAIFTDANPA